MKEEIRNGEKWIIVEEKETYEARDSSHVEARDSSHVVAWDSSHVVARDSSHVVARDSSHVEARDFVSIIQKSKYVKIEKSKKVIIIIPNYPSTIEKWAEFKGIKIGEGKIRLWKCVKKDGTDFYTGKISYLGEAIAPDWDKDYKSECGKGLHLADSPSGARFFVGGKEFRLFQVEAKLKDCRCFGGNPECPMKIRVRACKFVKEFPPDYIEGRK